jgi:hypothetical protein
MAYNSDNLGALAYCNGFTLWHYRSSDDPAATIKAAGYFNDAAQLLTLGDIITFQDQLDVSGMRRIAVHTGTSVNTGALG